MKRTYLVSLLALSCLLLSRSATAEDNQTSSTLRALPTTIKSGQLAFSYFHNGQSDIYFVDFKTNQILPLVTSPKNDEYPRWSPDRLRLAFYSNRSGNNEIYTVSNTGSDLKQITNAPGADEDPSWSPDGKKLVFQSDRQKKGLNLYVVESNGGNATALTTVDKRTTVPDWSADGKTIVFSTDYYWPGWDLVLYDIATKKTSRITDGVLSYCRASWRSDDARIVYSEGADDTINIKTKELSSGVEIAITSGPGRKYDPTYSYDGAYIFFVAESKPGSGDFQIHAYETATDKRFQITEGPGYIRYLSFNQFSTTPVTDVTHSTPMVSPPPSEGLMTTKP